MTVLRPAILPSYLLLCLLVGGSRQAIWGNAALQLLAVAILAWAVLTRDPPPLTTSGRRLLMLAGALVLLIILQLLPLPPELWSMIPGRRSVVDGFSLLAMDLPWLPISEAPYDTLTTAMTLLPPLALLVGMLRLRAWNARWMMGAIIAGALLSVALGVVQVASGGAGWYFYRITNLGVAVGTFANGNHFATLLLVAIPVLAALVAVGLRSEKKEQRTLTVALAAMTGAILAVGVLVNSSAALFLLGPPVAVASVMLTMRLDRRRIMQGAAGLLLLLAAAGAILAVLGSRFPGWGTSASIETRASFWSHTAEAIHAEGLAGSGFGTFESVYSRHEDPAEVTRFYVNHAHNDYLEIALEGGVPALVLIAVFLVWWAGRAREAWMEPSGSPEMKAAAVASAAILLHSVFDYPLRTAAIMAVMAWCLAILGGAKGVEPAARSAERRARHATL